ncbi:MAG: hypothetical protein PHG75_04040 [Syntrophomonas sp.]|nr:hypothetical protein [Syntrophomonas sp.]
MINDLHGNAECQACNHFGFCKIYWGPECKRQGGTRTPRLKSAREGFKNETMEMAGLKQRTKRVSLDQPIRTRVVNW